MIPTLDPLEPLLADPDIVEIMINRYDRVFVERAGRIEAAPNIFAGPDELLAVVAALREFAAVAGRRLDDQNPVVDMRLDDMSRVNVVLPPISAYGPAVTIRKMYRFKLTVEDLLRFGTWDEAIVTFLRACVGARLNLIVAGGTNSGKTTVLNNVIGMIPPHERVITVENAVELQPPPSLTNLVRLESRPPDADGRGEVTIQSLIMNAMRMRPDRLVLGEARSSEVLDILQAINTGHEGTLFSIHANGVRDVLMRLEMMCAMHPIAFPLLTIRHMIASAINVIVYQERLRDGRRRVVKIAEVLGMQGDSIALNDIFEYRQTGVDGDGHITGYFTATGETPAFLDRIKWAGISLPEDLFVPR